MELRVDFLEDFIMKGRFTELFKRFFGPLEVF